MTDRNGNTTKYMLDGNGNIVKTVDAAGTGSEFTYDSMDRLTKITMHRVDTVHGVDEYQETLYTYDHRGLIKTEVNAKGDGKAFVYDGNGNLIRKTDEDGYVTEYEYSPVNLVSSINYNDAKSASYLYNGTGELVEMEDWNGKTSIGRDLLNRVTEVTDHNGRKTAYGWDNVGNKTVQGYPDGTQVDYYYDKENQIVEMKDFDGGITKFAYDGNGNKTFKEYPNYETAYYFYDACDRIIEMDEYNIGGKKLFKTTYSWDAEGNRLSEMQYNHGQSGSSGNGNSGNKGNEKNSTGTVSAEAPAVEIPSVDTEKLSTTVSVVNRPALPDPTADTAAGVVLRNQSDTAQETNIRLLNTGKGDASIEGNGDGNGQVPPGQTEEEDGTIVNPGGNTPPGLNRGEKGEKPDNPNKPVKPDNPGTEDSADKKANKANKGTHKYGYDNLNRMTSSNIAGTTITYTYDTLGNLVLEKTKNKVVDYQYNELNQLTKKKEGNESYSYTYDKRGNRTAEIGKKASRSYVYDETNRMVEGTNWKGDRSAYTYNGLGLRVNNTHTTHAGKVYARDYVIDYTSFENDDLMVFAQGNGQLEYEQKHVYAGSERIEQFTDKGNWERTLYVHEDVMGNTRYYTKANGQSFAELTYDAWGMPVSPNKLLNNDHGNYVFATFTGHIYDTTLDIYFAEARFYDANNRTWLAMDPMKDGGNWYQYCFSNPTTFYDPTGLAGFSPFSGCVDMNKLAEQMQSGFRDWKGKLAEFADNIDWGRVGVGLLKTGSALAVLAIGAAAVVATGGAALPAVMGLLAGTVTAGTAIVTVGTFVAGSAAVAFGFADILEAAQDVGYGTVGSSKASFNPLRDTMFTGNEDLYYGLEMLTTLIASAGTATFRSFNMESEINMAEKAGYGKGGFFESNNDSTYIPMDADGNPIPLNKQRINGQDIPLPDPEAQGRPHTVLGGKVSSETGEVYRQTATFRGGSWPTANGYEVPLSEVHWTNHGRADEHTNPHQHVFNYDFDNKYWYRSAPEIF